MNLKKKPARGGGARVSTMSSKVEADKTSEVDPVEAAEPAAEAVDEYGRGGVEARRGYRPREPIEPAVRTCPGVESAR